MEAREEENVIRCSVFVIRFRKAIKNRGGKKTRNEREGVTETMRNNREGGERCEQRGESSEEKDVGKWI